MSKSKVKTRKISESSAQDAITPDLDAFDDLVLHIHPESMVELVFDMREQGMSDEQITEEIAKMKQTILLDYKIKLSNGDIDDDAFEEISVEGCGDPSCPNCSTSVTYH